MSHDHGYKRLFSHPEMVKDSLTGFVHEEWVDQCDFDSQCVTTGFSLIVHKYLHKFHRKQLTFKHQFQETQ